MSLSRNCIYMIQSYFLHRVTSIKKNHKTSMHSDFNTCCAASFCDFNPPYSISDFSTPASHLLHHHLSIPPPPGGASNLLATPNVQSPARRPPPPTHTGGRCPPRPDSLEMVVNGDRRIYGLLMCGQAIGSAIGPGWSAGHFRADGDKNEGCRQGLGSISVQWGRADGLRMAPISLYYSPP